MRESPQPATDRTQSRRQLSSYATVTISMLVLGLVLVRLGLWQLDRAAEKEQRYQDYTQRFAAPPVDLLSLRQAASHAILWQRITAVGQFVGPAFLLDNRTRNGRVGFEVLCVFNPTSGQPVLVNRGWVASPSRRELVPTIDIPEGNTTISGHVGTPPVSGIKLNSDAYEIELIGEGLVRLQTVDVVQLNERFALNLRTDVIYLDKQSAAGFDRRWKPPGDGAAKHHAYAVQWFAMAVVLAIIYLLMLRRALSTAN